MNKDQFKQLLAELKTGLAKIYGKRLKGLYVFGSYARGEQAQESDLDLLVVLDDFDHYGAEVGRTSQLASDLSLRYDLSISNVFARESEWLRGQSPFFRNIRQEAVAA